MKDAAAASGVVYNAMNFGVVLQTGAESWHQLQLLRIAAEAGRSADRDTPSARTSRLAGEVRERAD